MINNSYIRGLLTEVKRIRRIDAIRGVNNIFSYFTEEIYMIDFNGDRIAGDVVRKKDRVEFHIQYGRGEEFQKFLDSRGIPVDHRAGPYFAINLEWFNVIEDKRPRSIDEVKRVNINPKEIIKMYDHLYDWSDINYEKKWDWAARIYEALDDASGYVDPENHQTGGCWSKDAFARKVDTMNKVENFDKIYNKLKDLYQITLRINNEELDEVKRVREWDLNYGANLIDPELVQIGDIIILSSGSKWQVENFDDDDDPIHKFMVIVSINNPHKRYSVPFWDHRYFIQPDKLDEVKRINDDLRQELIQKYQELWNLDGEYGDWAEEAIETEEFVERANLRDDLFTYLEQIDSFVSPETEGTITPEIFQELILKDTSVWPMLLKYMQNVISKFPPPKSDKNILENWEKQIIEVKRINLPNGVNLDNIKPLAVEYIGPKEDVLRPGDIVDVWDLGGYLAMYSLRPGVKNESVVYLYNNRYFKISGRSTWFITPKHNEQIAQSIIKDMLEGKFEIKQI
jgi:hypothetical protein